MPVVAVTSFRFSCSYLICGRVSEEASSSNVLDGLAQILAVGWTVEVDTANFIGGKIFCQECSDRRAASSDVDPPGRYRLRDPRLSTKTKKEG